MDLLRESTPYFLEALIITAYFRLTVVLVYNLDGPAASAVFSTGQGLGLLLGVIPINAGLAALPRIVEAARTSPIALDGVIRLIWRQLVPLGLLTTLVACATAHWWLGWILGPKSQGVWIHFVLFGASRLAVFVSVPAIFALDALRRQSLRVRVSVISGISVAVIGIPLQLVFGAFGMSAYLAVLEIAIAVAYVHLLRRNRSLAGSVPTFESPVLLRDPVSALTEPME
jgi:O-antigen/teichoic acid export membrane protein